MTHITPGLGVGLRGGVAQNPVPLASSDTRLLQFFPALQ